MTKVTHSQTRSDLLIGNKWIRCLLQFLYRAQEFIASKMDKGPFGTPSEYIRPLIRQDPNQAGARTLEHSFAECFEAGQFLSFPRATGLLWQRG